MVETAFFRTRNGKCPNCGTFGDDQENDESFDTLACPSCYAVFNRYIILEQGEDVELKNN